MAELNTEWREHTLTYEWNADYSNWMPTNYEASTIRLEPYHKLVDGTLSTFDSALWSSRTTRVMTEGQGIITRIIETSRGGAFEAVFSDPYWLDNRMEEPGSARRCATILLIDVRRCYDAGDLDGAMERLAAVYRIIRQFADAESEIASMSAQGIYTEASRTTELLLEAWAKGGPNAAQSAELIAAIDALDQADPFGYLRALVLSSEQVLAWARESEDPAAELYAQWQQNPEYLEYYLYEGMVVPDTLEAFRGWMILQWGYSHELLVYHAEQQLRAVKSLVKNWDTLSNDRNEPEWDSLAAHMLAPFSQHVLELYTELYATDEYMFMDDAWKKRGMYSDISKARELRERLPE